MEALVERLKKRYPKKDSKRKHKYTISKKEEDRYVNEKTTDECSALENVEVKTTIGRNWSKYNCDNMVSFSIMNRKYEDNEKSDDYVGLSKEDDSNKRIKREG